MEAIIVGFILLAHLAIVIERYIKFQKLSKEDKDSYNDGVYKINNITKANQRYRIIGFIGFVVALFVVAPVIIIFSKPIVSSTSPINTVQVLTDKIWAIIINIIIIYIAVYFVSRIIFEYVYIRKGIRENNHLTQRERELLNSFYTKSPIRYIGTATLLEIIPFMLNLILSIPNGSGLI